ncbi:MAG TPA: phenylalanine--tRNA ligase subunit alpha, partial [Candidatus Edwardsbacteria bacterium]|nr:phenylalanine--tRNA ligase subunit alpha [Candidatus Edwardsbacteria bacterium]
MMDQQLSDIEREAAAQAAACGSLAALEELRVQYLGRKGAITELLKSVSSRPAAERPAFGAAVNALKGTLTALLDDRKAALARIESQRALQAERLDVTLPGRAAPLGHRHPLSQVFAEIVDIFHGIGYSVAEGPDVETEWHNFDALNTPADHPARNIQDTFYIKDAKQLLLRTHTSPVQIRTMMGQKPPVRIIAPGRCYRRDAIDASHMPVFQQCEGLYVDRNVSMADLKATISYFARRLMGDKVKVRFRPHFFPFTEPSVEYDFSCVFCQGKGCRVCKQSGWLEISGAGMVDPNVFKNV